MFDKKLNIFVVLFLIFFITISYLSLFNNRLPFFTRASETEIDITKSIIIANKLEAKADNNDFVEVNVFVRNSDGKTLENKPVAISSTLGDFDKISYFSDNYGKVTFRLKSIVAGTAIISAQVDSQPISNTLTVKFSQN